MMVKIGGKHTRGREKEYAEELVKAYRENKEGGEMLKVDQRVREVLLKGDLELIHKRVDELANEAHELQRKISDLSFEAINLFAGLAALTSTVRDIVRGEEEEC